MIKSKEKVGHSKAKAYNDDNDNYESWELMTGGVGLLRTMRRRRHPVIIPREVWTATKKVDRRSNMTQLQTTFITR